ncbi:hypothetical protein [Streptomyces sp. NPDC091268]|uniref:hypothetical protein n=1 Tax=Streptomyces sp. NPDC091268 TaxID=3365979 RepID=UPI003811222B
MNSRHKRSLVALGAAPIVALLAFSPPASGATAHAPASAPGAASAPSICHKLSTATDMYTKGCREGVRKGREAGRKNGSPPICQKLPPPLAPVKPSAYEQGLVAGYKYGYDQAFPVAYKQNCSKQPPAPQQPPKPPAQTEQSMFENGRTSGTALGAQDAKACNGSRPNANLTPPKNPDTLILAFQSGYRVGYDTAYDEAFRQNCLNMR